MTLRKQGSSRADNPYGSLGGGRDPQMGRSEQPTVHGIRRYSDFDTADIAVGNHRRERKDGGSRGAIDYALFTGIAVAVLAWGLLQIGSGVATLMGDVDEAVSLAAGQASPDDLNAIAPAAGNAGDAADESGDED